MILPRVGAAICCLIALASCVHPNRISRGNLNRFTRDGEPFVLVFGSLTTPVGAFASPTIRFSRQVTPSAPTYLLHSLTITTGDRFYAILRPPDTPASRLTYLDEFYIEVGTPDMGFDRIDYVRLSAARNGQALYVGEIEMSPAAARTVPGQKIDVNVRDELDSATRELKRLYPRFHGTVSKAIAPRRR